MGGGELMIGYLVSHYITCLCLRYYREWWENSFGLGFKRIEGSFDELDSYKSKTSGGRGFGIV